MSKLVDGDRDAATDSSRSDEDEVVGDVVTDDDDATTAGGSRLEAIHEPAQMQMSCKTEP
jgi:hypothetical protein